MISKIRLSLLIRHLRRKSATSSHTSSASSIQIRHSSYLPYIEQEQHDVQDVLTAPLPELSFLSKLDDIRSYEDLWNFSINRSDEFWEIMGRNRLHWFQQFGKISECDMQQGKFCWFKGGKLNAAYNCVDRHVKIDPDKIALIWEKDEPGQHEKITYKQLYTMMGQIANVLKKSDVKKGDRVVIYMPNSPMAVASMLACARLGAIHSVISAGFSPKAVAQRVNNAGARVIITTDQAPRGGKTIELKKMVDEAVEMCPLVSTILVSTRTGSQTPLDPKRDVKLEETMEKESEDCMSEMMDSEDPLFLLYTSGSTGSPKGLVHTHAGYLLYASLTQQMVFNHGENDVFGCMADIGSITGHSYVVYGPLCNGATTVLFESTPTYPNPARYWETVGRLKINQLYTSPTAIRLLLKYGGKWVHGHDLSSLKVLGSVGEPITHEAWLWYYHVVGKEKCPVVDTWCQTETGGICIAPHPASPAAPIIPGAAMRPFLGTLPCVIDEEGHEVEGNNVTGALCLKKPWPGIARTIYGSHEKYMNSYFKQVPGYYYTGDRVRRDESGFYHITGRLGDVINASSHHLSTAEVEDVLV